MAAERTDWESRITNIGYIQFDRDIYIFSINEPAVWPIPNIAFFKTTGHNKKHEEFAGTLLPMLGSIPPDRVPQYQLMDDLLQDLDPNFIIKCSSVKEFAHDMKKRPRWQFDIYTEYFQALHPYAFSLLDLTGKPYYIVTDAWSEHEISVCELMIYELGRLDTLFNYFLFDWQLKISIRASGGFWHNELGRKFIRWYREKHPSIVIPIRLEPVLTPLPTHDILLYTLLDAYIHSQITDRGFVNLQALTRDGFFVKMTHSLYTQLVTAQTQINIKKSSIERERAQERALKKRSSNAAAFESRPPNRPALNGGKYTKKNKRSKMSRNKKYKKSKRCKLKKCTLTALS